jgi:hypothetical protein
MSSPSKNALRTQRDTQWYHRVTVRSTNFARAIAMGNLLWGHFVILYAMPDDSSRSVSLPVFKNQHRDGFSLIRHGREAMQCVSFPYREQRLFLLAQIDPCLSELLQQIDTSTRACGLLATNQL